MKKIIGSFLVLFTLIFIVVSCGDLTTTPDAATKSTDATLSDLTVSDTSLSPAFSSSTISYTATEAASVLSIKVKAVANNSNYTSITINGSVTASDVSSDSIDLITGGQTIITVVVTAEDGTTQKTYTVTVTHTPPISYIVSGAGSGVVNGTYNVSTDLNGKAHYTNGTYHLYYYNDAAGDGEIWIVANNTNGAGRVINLYYYYVQSSDDYPPLSGWLQDGDGSNPVPTLAPQ